MKGRRPGSKGNEWLLIKKVRRRRSSKVYDIEEFDDSVLGAAAKISMRSPETPGSREWKSRPTGRGKSRLAWLADAVAKLIRRRARRAAPKKNPNAPSERERQDAKSAKQQKESSVAVPANPVSTKPLKAKSSRPPCLLLAKFLLPSC